MQGCEIKTGDVIKMGRLEYLIGEMRICENEGLVTHSKPPDGTENVEQREIIFQFETKGFETKQDYTEIEVTRQTKEFQKTCRICLLEEGMGVNDEDDFFVNPCTCKGSCEFVHIQCLKQWIKNKTVIKPSGCTVTYQWKKLECEVCKTALPKRMKLNDKIIELVTIEKPQTAYLLLEKICRESKSISCATIIQFLPGETIKIGRGHQCDLRISDISVSRCHSKIVYEKGHFRIFDNNSKFGTLVMLREPYRISEEKVAVQVGRTVVTFAVRRDKKEERSLEGQMISFNLNRGHHQMASGLSSMLPHNFPGFIQSHNQLPQAQSQPNMSPVGMMGHPNFIESNVIGPNFLNTQAGFSNNGQSPLHEFPNTLDKTNKDPKV